MGIRHLRTALTCARDIVLQMLKLRLMGTRGLQAPGARGADAPGGVARPRLEVFNEQFRLYR